MQQLVTRAEFARMAAVSRPTVTKVCKGRLLAACVDKRIDLAHPAARSYLERKGSTRHRLDPSSPESIADLAELESMVQAIVDKYGPAQAIGDWIMLRRRIATCRKLESEVAARDGRLISTDFVSTHIFGFLNALSLRLLRDTPKTVARCVSANARSDVPLEESTTVVRDLISGQLQLAKKQILTALKERKEGHDDDTD